MKYVVIGAKQSAMNSPDRTKAKLAVRVKLTNETNQAGDSRNR